MYKGKSYKRRKRRLMFARIRTLVILVLVVWGIINLFQNSGESKNDDKPVDSQNVLMEPMNNNGVGAYRQDNQEVYDNTDKDGIDYVPDSNIPNLYADNENSPAYNEDSDTQNQASEEVCIDDWRLILVNADNRYPMITLLSFPALMKQGNLIREP